jgi:hypothetical protein
MTLSVIQLRKVGRCESLFVAITDCNNTNLGESVAHEIEMGFPCVCRD